MSEAQSMTIEQLQDEWAKRKAWIESPSNDGRLSTGSSAQLDFCWDIIEEVEKELRRRGHHVVPLGHVEMFD